MIKLTSIFYIVFTQKKKKLHRVESSNNSDHKAYVEINDLE